MMYNFDEIIDRKNSYSIKYAFTKEHKMPDDIIPMWVADMDFPSCKEIHDGITEIIAHGIYGYSDMKEEYSAAVTGWYSRRFSWNPDPQWIVRTPGVVFAVANAVRAYTKEGDGVLIQRPVYYPFAKAITDNNRKVVNNALIKKDDSYVIDFDDFEKQIIDNHVRLFILCSPHNPISRVWTKDELTQMGDICLRHGVIVVSDEIHSDFIWSGAKHYIFADLKPEFAHNSIICTAPSKTFNLAALQTSNIFIKNKDLRDQFKMAIKKLGLSNTNIIGMAACKAAYEFGEGWLEELKIYLEGNIHFFQDYLKNELPQLSMARPDGTYLLWVDFSNLHMDDASLDKFMVNDARLWLDGGTMFGPEGSQHQRFNVATQRSVLEKALNHLKDAINK